MAYDIAAGMDCGTLNLIASELYAAVYPALFKGSVDVDQEGVASVDYDVTAAPTASFDPSDRAVLLDHLKNDPAHSGVELSAEHEATLSAQVAAASFGVDTTVSLTIHYSNGKQTSTQATLAAVLSIQAETKGGENFVTLQAVSGNVTTSPSDPLLESLLNNAFIRRSSSS